MQIAIHVSQNLIFKAFADDNTWLQLFMHIQRPQQNTGMINPTCPSTRLPPCFSPATSPAVHIVINSTEVNNGFLLNSRRLCKLSSVQTGFHSKQRFKCSW